MKKYRGQRFYATETKTGWVVVDREKTRLQDDVVEKFATRMQARKKADQLNSQLLTLQTSATP